MSRLTDAAVAFLRGIQRFIRATESLLIDIISLVIPWASPLIPAYMAWNSMSTRLDFPAWVSIAGASVVELLGLATINTAFEFWSYNQDKRKIDGRAPVWLAITIAVFYLAVVLTVNTMLDESPPVYRIAKALLSSLTIAGGVIIALRAGHSKRLEGIEQERIERRQIKLSTISLPFLADHNPTLILEEDLYQKKHKKICANCGKEFSGTAKSTYCSDACRQASYRKRNVVTPTS